MGKIILGRVRPVYQGAYDETKAYEPLDRVLYNGNVYECVLATTAGTPPSTEDDTYWSLLGVKGETGDKGEKGDKGDQGERGAEGAAGSDGAMGATPAHKWDGTKLSFENADGTYDDGVDLQGPQGVKGDQGEQGPAVPLSNSITSTSQTDAASSYAVYQVKNSSVECRNTDVVIYLDSTNGNDTLSLGRGLSASLPFKTWSAAWSYTRGRFNTSQVAVTFKLAAGSYYGNISVANTLGIYISGESVTNTAFWADYMDIETSSQVSFSSIVIHLKTRGISAKNCSLCSLTNTTIVLESTYSESFVFNIRNGGFVLFSGNACTINTTQISNVVAFLLYYSSSACIESTKLSIAGTALQCLVSANMNSMVQLSSPSEYVNNPKKAYEVQTKSVLRGGSGIPYSTTAPSASGNSVVNDSRCTLYSGSVCV